MEYKIIFSEAEDLAMKNITYSVDDWVYNACHNRAKQSMDAIISRSISKFLDAGIQIPSSREDIVLAAFANGWEKNASDRHDEIAANTTIIDSFKPVNT